MCRKHLFCNICKVVARKDVKTEHCEDCGYCMEELDHHCPWSSKCIARRNVVIFKIWFTSLFGLCVFAPLAMLYCFAEVKNLK